MLSLRNKKFKSVPSASKVILTVFWDLNGPILKHSQDHGQTVMHGTGLYLKLITDSKRRRMLTNGVVLHHNNT
jgi:hypothetical protein